IRADLRLPGNAMTARAARAKSTCPVAVLSAGVCAAGWQTTRRRHMGYGAVTQGETGDGRREMGDGRRGTGKLRTGVWSQRAPGDPSRSRLGSRDALHHALAFDEHLFERVRRQRMTEQVTLHDVATLGLQELEVLLGFHAFGDHLAIEVVRH